MTKTRFTVIFIFGLVSAFMMALSPLHEIWHYLAARMSGVGARMEWTETFIYGRMTLLISFSGIFGETVTLYFIFMLMCKLKWYKLSAYFLGYMSVFNVVIISLIGGHIPMDIQLAYEIASTGVVNFITFAWVILYLLLFLIQILTINQHKMEIFSKNVDNKIIRV